MISETCARGYMEWEDIDTGEVARMEGQGHEWCQRFPYFPDTSPDCRCLCHRPAQITIFELLDGEDAWRRTDV